MRSMLALLLVLSLCACESDDASGGADTGMSGGPDVVEPASDVVADTGEPERLNPAGVSWVALPGGSYWMGCAPNDAECDDAELPRHEVTLEPFEVAETETTCAQMALFLNAEGNDCGGGNDCVNAMAAELCVQEDGGVWTVVAGMEDLPQNHVTWFGAWAFCDWAGGRLPSESEWEYFGRGGAETVYACGDDASCLDDVAWGWANSDGARHAVAQKAANGFGLYDVQGNVWEWVEDCYVDSYEHAPNDGSPVVTDTCLTVVLRGGSWDEDGGSPQALRLSRRGKFFPSTGDDDGGFRCVRAAAE